MTFRERLVQGLGGEPTDIMPWFADLTYWYGATRGAGSLPPEYEGEQGFVRLHRDLKVGYYLGYASAYHDTHEGVEVLTETAGAVTRSRWVTPVGEIVGETTYLPHTASSAPTRWAVRTPEDLRVLRYLAEATRTVADYTDLEEKKRLAGDQGHPTVLPPRSPVSQLLAQWTGATNLSFLYADAREELEATLAALARAADGAYLACCGADTPFIELPDNLSGEVVGGLFLRYQFDYYLQRVEQIHAAGKVAGVHLDGSMRQILSHLARTGLDFIEGFAPQPTGDLSLAELRDYAGPALVLFGGVPGAMFAPPFTAEMMRRHVETVFAHHWPHGRFLLAVGDQVPPNADVSLVRLVGELCEELSR